MDNLKVISALERKMDKILRDDAAQRAKLEGQISADVAAAAKAQEDMDAAAAAEDAKAYSKAKAVRTEAEDSKEMHEIRLNALNSKQMITVEEYDQAVKEVNAELADLDNRKRKQLADLCDQMDAIAQEVDQATRKANEVLRRLQHDVYRDQDRSKDANGNILFYDRETKTAVDTSSTITWGKVGVRSGPYQVYTSTGAFAK